jgi:hypothetical protein
MLPLPHCRCPPAAATTLLLSSLPHFFCLLIVDSFIPLPQLLALAAAAAAVAAVILGLPMRLQRQESARDLLFANRMRLSL